jgi:O-antigen/teichoic acid export membrane protein
MNTPYSKDALRQNILHFFSGKVISAALTAVLLILVSRKLDNQSYGAYATIIALLEIGYSITSFGLGWISQRYIPDYRIHATQYELKKFIFNILLIRAATLLIATSLLGLLAPQISPFLHLQNFIYAFTIYSAVLAFEGLGRNLRDELLSALMQQKTSQIALVLRNSSLLIMVYIASTHGLTLVNLAWMELISSIISTGLALILLWHHLNKLILKRDLAWEPPSFVTLYKMARAMYVSFLLNIATSSQIFVLIVNGYLGLEAAATFGFARNLNELLRRYLPAELLMGFIRPKLVADYSQHKDINRLVLHARFAWKLSLIILAPAFAFLLINGNQLSDLISAGKYPQAGSIIAGLSLSLIPFSQRRVLETLSNIMNHSEACIKASAYALFALPTALLLIYTGMGLWGIVIALAFTEVIFNFSLIRSIQNAGCPYKISIALLVKLGITTSVTALGLYLIPTIAPTWINITIMGVLAGTIATIVGGVIGFFDYKERSEMLSFIKTRRNKG